MELIFKMWVVASLVMTTVTFVPAIMFNFNSTFMRNACGHVVSLPFKILFAPFLVLRRIVIETTS